MAISRPRPVLTTNAIMGAIMGLAGILGFLGYAHLQTTLSADAQTLTSIVIGAGTLGAHLLAGLHGQGAVTPTVSPQAADGTPLVKAITAITASATETPSTNAAQILAAASAIHP